MYFTVANLQQKQPIRLGDKYLFDWCMKSTYEHVAQA